MQLSDDLGEHVHAVLPEVVALRHHLHAHPELSGEEEQTARTVCAALDRLGIPYESGVGDTHGVVGMIDGAAGDGPTLALRADMDALPIHEETDAAYCSQVPGVMHACGHDGHTATLLGAAMVLSRMRDRLPGRIKLVFQPAEETVRGADVLVDAGVVDDVAGIVMLHGWPTLEIGQIGVRSGPVMASSDNFSLTIRGHGGHGGYPHNTIDPIIVGAQIVSSLQTIVSREMKPVNPCVLSVTTFHAGSARNVIPEMAELTGTVRTLDARVRKEIPERMERIIGGVCEAFRAKYEFHYRWGTPATVNDAAVTDLVRRVGGDLLGAENVVELPEATMGAEDFAYYLERVPGAMFRLGTGCPSLLHTPRYDFGDAPLAPGIAMMVETARRYLREYPLEG